MYRWSVANRPSANGTDTTIEMSPMYTRAFGARGLRHRIRLEARPRRGHLEGSLLGGESSEPEGNDSDEKRQGQDGERSLSRDRCHQHQVGHGGGEAELESGLGLAEVFRLPLPS